MDMLSKPPSLSLNEVQELCRQTDAIIETYRMGNKNTARAMFALLPDTQKAFAAVRMYTTGQRGEFELEMQNFIYSVTS